MANPYTAYLESKVLAASPLQLVHLAYEGAIDAVIEARGHLAENRIVPRVQAVTRAQQFIIQLQASLDYEKGGDLSKRLSSLYDYMLRRLNDGNRLSSDEAFTEVQNLMATLDEAWKEVATDTHMGAAASVGGASYPGGSSSSWMTADPWASPEPPAVYTSAGYL